MILRLKLNLFKNKLGTSRKGAGIADFMMCVKPGEESIQIGQVGKGQTPIIP